MKNKKPFLLLILDGFGYREDTSYNAIAQAKTPNWDHLWLHHPHLLIEGSGHYVGLPDGQMGNSEVGHLNIGAGRVLYQDLTRIDQAIANQQFQENPILLEGINQAKQHQSAIHLIGLLSPGGVHSHEDHFIALIELAAKHHQKPIYVHAFLDGRDTPPKSAENSLAKIDHVLRSKNIGRIASIVGRYYAMDRDKRYERTEEAYRLLTESYSQYRANNAIEALHAAYQRGETDEFVKATIIEAPNQPAIKISDHDVIFFMNFRADRARQLCYAILNKDFKGFKRNTVINPASFITLTEYDKNLAVPIAFQTESIHNNIGEYLSSLGMTQLRIAETEKYAHVTFFFNSGREQPYQLEERILIPSPKVATYDLAPEMSAYSLTEKLVEAIESQKYDFIVCNYANPDMVGHTGNLDATIKAIEVIDECLGNIINALKKVTGEMFLTADHGNAECLYDEENHQPHTAHTHERVPLVYFGKSAHILSNHGQLADIAPSILHLLNLSIPKEMTGKVLFELN